MSVAGPTLPRIEHSAQLLAGLMVSKHLQMRRVRARHLVVMVVALVLFAIGVLLTTSDSTSTDPAPDVTFEFFDGSSQQLSELRGKPVVLNFWASWCPVCISEMPVFANVHRRLGDEVEFIGVNVQEVDLEAAQELVEQTNVDYRLAHDRDGAIYNRFGGVAMPTTVFISAEGAVEKVHSGTIFEDELTDTIEIELLE